ncbi:MAG: adenine deaminase [Chitinophagia bacterium]|jgi:adenine deaminase|nr:adenine deaminase [Chitinophagia bacterium]
MSTHFKVTGQYVDILGKQIFPAIVTIEDGIIASVTSCTEAPNQYILPGFIDSHVHVESSMLIPSSFARIAVTHGTIGTISDPHEIANVCGMEGVHYMIQNGKKVPFHFFFGAPSCVPATAFETAGAAIDSDQVSQLLALEDIFYLSEMMNFPGVLHADSEVMKKIRAAHKAGKPVDGHAPGLRGEDAKKYIEAGISTDHECFTIEEAIDKLSYGMKILIREGSAAKNFEALYELIDDHPHMMMLCSDDKHPDSLVEGHINQLCARAVAKGLDVFNILRAACINPVIHYKLPTGMLLPKDPANFIVVKDLVQFEVLQTYIKGKLVAIEGKSLIPHIAEEAINQFDASPIDVAHLQLSPKEYPQNEGLIPVIQAIDGQLITNCLWCTPCIENNLLISNTQTDILKMVVYNRYFQAPPKIAFIKNFGFKEGAIASTVAHDSHNIIAVGVDDESIAKAINLVIQEKGGVSCVTAQSEKVLGLPVAGLMSHQDPYQVAADYTIIDKMSKDLGSSLGSPFMTLSFMALLVIPHLKLSDKGLFDGDQFKLF